MSFDKEMYELSLREDQAIGVDQKRNLLARIAELETVLKEIANHLYEKQDYARVRAMADEVLKKGLPK